MQKPIYKLVEGLETLRAFGSGHILSGGFRLPGCGARSLISLDHAAQRARRHSRVDPDLDAVQLLSCLARAWLAAHAGFLCVERRDLLGL